MITLDTHELAWAAGFFDGEGSPCSYIQRNKSIVINLSVGQKDPLLLYKFQKIVGGYGHVYNKGSKATYKNGSQTIEHELQIRKFEYVQYVMCLLWKWLGPFKKEQYRKSLEFYLSNCYKPKFDKRTLFDRERWRLGSSSMVHKARLHRAFKNIDSNHVFINPFVKANV